MSSFIYPPSTPSLDILIGCTGSIASVKLPKLSLTLHSLGYTHSIVLTKASSFFIDEEHQGSAKVYDSKTYEEWKKLVDSGIVRVYRSDDEWDCLRNGIIPPSVSPPSPPPGKFRCPVLHITLRTLHALLLIAPLSANSLSKYSLGLCDDTLSSVVRAWEMEKDCIICPAINTGMWEHPVTGRRLEEFKGFWKGMEGVCCCAA
mmetsp:Transcript_24988/g.46985  ORF Transcript_24988/g.46985 Transcript_24988/m.46985 type:complete len:203 (+) Transcript_24988:170-778(+)